MKPKTFTYIVRGLMIVVIWLTLIILFAQIAPLPQILKASLSPKEYTAFLMGQVYTGVALFFLLVLIVAIWILIYSDRILTIKKSKEVKP